MSEELKIMKLDSVNGLIKEITFLEHYLFESPWKYIGEGKSLEPTFREIKKHLNEVLNILNKKIAYPKQELISEFVEDLNIAFKKVAYNNMYNYLKEVKKKWKERAK